MAIEFTKTTGKGQRAEVSFEVRKHLGRTEPVAVLKLDGKETAIGAVRVWPVKVRAKGLEHCDIIVAEKLPLTSAEAGDLLARYEAVVASHKAEKASELAEAVPGLELVRKAARDQAEYLDARSRWIAADCLGMGPIEPTSDYQALAREYPRAALFVRAEWARDSLSESVHFAGARTIEILTAGGSIEAAEAELNPPVTLSI